MSQLNEFIRTFSANINQLQNAGYDMDNNNGVDLFVGLDSQTDKQMNMIELIRNTKDGYYYLNGSKVFSGKVTGGIKMDASSGMGMVGAIVWMVVLFGIMYFLMLRPQKKEQKRLQAMLNDMEVGDSIVTTGGFYGVVIDMTEEDVIVEFGNNKNCRIPMRKQAIAEVEKAGSAAE